MSIMLDDPSHIFPNLGSRWQIGKDVSDCGFSFKKSTIDDQIAEMASLNFTTLELSLFSSKKQRSKKIKKHFTTASEIKSYQEHPQKHKPQEMVTQYACNKPAS